MQANIPFGPKTSKSAWLSQNLDFTNYKKTRDTQLVLTPGFDSVRAGDMDVLLVRLLKPTRRLRLMRPMLLTVLLLASLPTFPQTADSPRLESRRGRTRRAAAQMSVAGATCMFLAYISI